MSVRTITVVDVGLGNVASVGNMLQRLGVRADVADRPSESLTDQPIILPGVGAFDTGIQRLQDAGWFHLIQQLPMSHPLLGICLGMQLLGTRSEEGQLPGLQRVSADFVRFRDADLRVPHMGWNHVTRVSPDPVFEALPEHPRYYFTHSYYGVCDRSEDVLATCHYGKDFVAAFRKEGTYGVQFHPEKSHKFGLALLGSWLENAC